MNVGGLVGSFVGAAAGKVFVGMEVGVLIGSFVGRAIGFDVGGTLEDDEGSAVVWKS